MSYVAGGKTYDEAGNEIDAFGAPLGGKDANVAFNQPKSANAAAMGTGSSASGGATIEDYTKKSSDTFGGKYGAGTGAGGNAGFVDPKLGGLYDQLLSRSQQSLTVDANDPQIKSQVDAASVAGQRSLLNNEKAFAERGGPYATGAIANNARMGAEHLGENLQGITAGAINNEVTARRQEIAQALSGMFGVLSLDQQTRLKQEDQKLASRQTDLSAQQQQWMQMFQEKGFTADQAKQLWEEMFNQQQADRGQANTTWDQTWKTSGGS